ncbi:hypothetical protein FRC07_002126 [Ceratobasidium sp. 392]|nr:hypothetical protein FRC07_002126 [Ceratobasidium sp. 392]
MTSSRSIDFQISWYLEVLNVTSRTLGWTQDFLLATSMANLTTPFGLADYLNLTKFEAIDIQVIVDGYNAFTYRVTLKNPGHERTVFVKHSLGYASSDRNMLLSRERMTFEYEALEAIARSRHYTSESTVQVPRVLFYDPKTYTLVMNDLAPACALPSVLMKAFETGTVESVSVKIGAALGDFIGRFHKWSAQPVQGELRKRFSKNSASKEFMPRLGYDRMILTAEKYGIRKVWMDKMVEDGMSDAQNEGSVLAMGDFWMSKFIIAPVRIDLIQETIIIDNILISTEHELRIYIIDWEMTSCARPEVDVASFVASVYGISHIHPSASSNFKLVQSFMQSYNKHFAVDEVQIALLSGRDVMSWGADVPWTKHKSGHVKSEIVGHGLELLEAAKDQNLEEIRRNAIVRDMYT